METLSHDDLISLLLAISSMLVLSRIFAEMGRKLGMPVVMGELIVGILLGPTVFGYFMPDVFEFIFPKTGSVPIALDGIVNIAVIMLLFVAGLEVQLPMVLEQGKTALLTSVTSLIVPFTLGFAAAWFFPGIFHVVSEENKLLFALFLGVALAISALPVIARILMDMNLFKTNIGMLIIASAMLNDLIGYLIFSLVLTLPGKGGGLSIGYTIAYILGFGLFMLTIGKSIINKTLPWMQAKLSWPGGVLSISLGICLLCAAFTQSINIHATLGAFIAGIAFGDSVHLHERAREIIHQFVTNFFAPLFFVSIGLKVNFVQNFDFAIVTIIIVLAYVGMVSGASLGARLGGLSKRDSLAVGFGMNARGAMEIILATLAMNAGIITPPIFVAIVVMALLTSLTSGPLMKQFVSTK